MDIKKLLNQDVINVQVINKALGNRLALVNDPHLNPTIEWFQLIRSVSDPVVMAYYLGNLDSIKNLISVCDSNLIPLFSGDKILIETTLGRSDIIPSDIFINHMLDGLADLDGMMTSNPNLRFKLLTIKSLKIIAENELEIENFKKFIDEIDLNIETESIKKHVVFLLNEEFKIHKLDIKNLSNIQEILKKLDTIMYKTTEHLTFPLIPPTKVQLINYAKTKDVLHLVKLIYTFARDGV